MISTTNKTSMRCISACMNAAAKSTLRTLADRLPEDARIPMLLGLDGDCDFPAA